MLRQSARSTDCEDEAADYVFRVINCDDLDLKVIVYWQVKEFVKQGFKSRLEQANLMYMPTESRRTVDAQAWLLIDNRHNNDGRYSRIDSYF